ncbi:UNVERIFIED_CONTAM: hypothetical protein GTU68_034686 [Idotea baltica]|nr:hypothetical protein [Idotea baltica]
MQPMYSRFHQRLLQVYSIYYS